jgi:hypothetical protein
MGNQSCFLSKCRYLNGVKCLKLAWYECNNPKMIPAPDELTQKIFNWGHFIGDKAKTFYPDGVENIEPNFTDHLEKSKEWLVRRIPLFEVAYMADNLYARPDIIVPSGDDCWNIVEVKCNTVIQEVNVRDIAYQRFVLEHAGLKIGQCMLMHPKPGVKITRAVPAANIFVQEDVTARAAAYLPEITGNIEKIRFACTLDNEPDVPCGEQCIKPYRCPLYDKCHKDDEQMALENCDLLSLLNEQIIFNNSVEALIKLATEASFFCVDNFETVAINSLQKAQRFAKFSSDYCDIAMVYHELKLSDAATIECLKHAKELAKLPADFAEIKRIEKQLS